jgi:hypothetical protein
MNMRNRSLALGLVIGAAIFLLASCTGSTATAQTDGASTSTTPPSSPPPADGLHTISGYVVGRGDYPTYTLEVPAGWIQYKHRFAAKAGGVDVMGVSVWDVGKVPLDPCNWRGTFRTPGPTVNDLVAALQAQRGRQTTTPKNVTFAGYHTRHFEWSAPSHWKVTGDADWAGCDALPSGHQDYIGWLGNGGGERYALVAGQTDRMWIFKVNGQRMLLDASFSPDATPAQISEMMQVAGSLRFS